MFTFVFFVFFEQKEEEEESAIGRLVHVCRDGTLRIFVFVIIAPFIYHHHHHHHHVVTIFDGTFRNFVNLN